MDQKNLIENRKYWQRIIEEFEQSGLSQKEFRSKLNIPAHKMSYYVTKYKSGNKRKAPPSAFTKIISKSEDKTKPTSIDPKWLAALIKELHAKS